MYQLLKLRGQDPEEVVEVVKGGSDWEAMEKERDRLQVESLRAGLDLLECRYGVRGG